MKTVINSTKGLVTYREGNKIILESTDEIQIKGDLTIAGTTTTNARVDDRIIELAHGTTGSRSSGLEDSGIIVERGDDDNVFFGWDESADMFTVGTGTFTGTSANLSLTLGGMQSQTFIGAALTGSATITVPASGLIIGSTAVGSTAAELNLLDGSAKSTSSITIADADAILVIDGNTTKQIPASDLKTYVGSSAGGTSLANLDIDGGTDIGAALVDADLLIVDDGASGTNRKTAMSRVKTYVSDLTLTTAAQANVTSLGTLTALTVDNVAINGATIGHTSDTDLITLADGEATIAGTLTATTLAGALSTAAQTAITSVGTLSTLAVSGDLTVDTSTLKVDSSNNRVGIGTASPDTLLHLYSSTASKPILKIENEQGGSNPVSIQMLRNTNTPADGDAIGQIDFRSMNDAGTPEEILYGYMTALSTDVTDGTEDGELQFYTMKNGALVRTLTLQSGNTGIGTADPTEALDVNSDAIRIRSSQTPGSASAAGTAGMICWDANYIYVCVDTNTWKRVAIGTW